MTQKRIHKYRDPDSTYLLNQKYLGIIDPGVYRGYDVDLQAGLTLALNHAITGVREIEITLAETLVGIAVSTQGVVIRDADALSLPIALGSTQFDRIDRVVMTHQYTAVEGGQQAIYSVITGTPSLTPVKPDFTNDKIQIEIGTLYVPKNMTSLLDVRVVWEKAPIPTYSNSNLLQILDELTLKKASNLLDVEDINAARGNLNAISELEARAVFPTRHKNTSPATTPRTIGVHSLPVNTYLAYSGYFGRTLAILTDEHCVYLENTTNMPAGERTAFLTKITPPLGVYEGYSLTLVCTGANLGLGAEGMGYEVFTGDETHIDCNLRLSTARAELVPPTKPNLAGFAVSKTFAYWGLPQNAHFHYCTNATIDLRWSTVANLWVEVGRSTKIS